MKFNLKSLTASSIVLATSVLGYQSAAANWSFSAGVYGSTGSTSFQYSANNRYSTTITNDDDELVYAIGKTLFTDSAKQHNFAIGYTLRADRFFSQKTQFWGLEVDSQNFGNSANLANSWNTSVGAWYYDDHSNLPENIENNFQLENQTNFSLAYGFQIDQHGNWLYLKAGASLARMKESAVSSIDIYNQNTDENGYGDRFLSDNLNSSSSKTSAWGAGLGMGLRHYFSQNWMLFAEYDYYYYGTHYISTLSQDFSLDTVDGNNTLTSTGAVTRQVKVASSSFKAGLAIVF